MVAKAQGGGNANLAKSGKRRPPAKEVRSAAIVAGRVMRQSGAMNGMYTRKGSMRSARSVISDARSGGYQGVSSDFMGPIAHTQGGMEARAVKRALRHIASRSAKAAGRRYRLT